MDAAMDTRQAEWERRTGWAVMHKGITGLLPGMRRDRKHERWHELQVNGRRVAAFDHTFTIYRHGEGKAWLLMPYGICESRIAELTAWCEDRRARWAAVGDGFWSEYGTIAIVVSSFECFSRGASL